MRNTGHATDRLPIRPFDYANGLIVMPEDLQPADVSTAAPLIVGLGECLWDCFSHHVRPGGAPANFAFQANQLGGSGRIVSRVGRDALGDDYLKHLSDHQLSTVDIQRDAVHPTGRATVSTTADGHPEFTIHQPAAWDFLEWTPALAETARQCQAVCYGSLAQRSEVTRTTIAAFLGETAKDCLRVFDVNLRQDAFTVDILRQSLDAASVCKMNEDEADILSVLLELGEPPRMQTEPLQRFAKEISLRFNVSLVCVTRAERGCVLVENDDCLAAAGTPVEVVDSVGAGDGFTAALVISTLEGRPLSQRAALANRVGGLIASHAGAMPDLANEYQQVRSEVFQQLN